MDAASRRGARAIRPARWAIVVVVFAVAVASGVVILSGRGGPSVTTLPVPSHVAVVYAKPVGKGFLVRREVVYSASPTGRHPVRLAVGTSPLLSPDGRLVAYVGGPLNRTGSLSLISAQGGAPRLIGLSGQPLAWSWDSRLLAAQGTHGPVIVDVRSLHIAPLRLPEASFNLLLLPGCDDARV